MVYERIAINVHSHRIIATAGNIDVPTDSITYRMLAKKVETAILRVSRQIYTEAYAIMKTNQFHEIKSTPFRVLINVSASEELKLCGFTSGKSDISGCKEWDRLPVPSSGRRINDTTIMEIVITGANYTSEWELRNMIHLLIGFSFEVRHVVRMTGNSSTTPEENCEVQSSSRNNYFSSRLLEARRPYPQDLFEQGTDVSETEFKLEWTDGDYYCASMR
ncbi:hypothetical protein CFE70_009379 [Pyrenophora teres f. teres 0-1]|uniref:Uncharacterized protein n=2 Tax=Pyrenophora teres f. teres TaxID=97479 RepID=E3RQK5_PYRTT|nr:hypothetical protein PTT_11014 [Pyrenophora teres f. teres 0-1]KAK1916515.1 hypothetical protein P3342_012139 [Pyrenophora teres f. teres]